MPLKGIRILTPVGVELAQLLLHAAQRVCKLPVRQRTNHLQAEERLFRVKTSCAAVPGSEFFPSRNRILSIPDPGSELFPSVIPDPHQRIEVF